MWNIEWKRYYKVLRDVKYYLIKCYTILNLNLNSKIMQFFSNFTDESFFKPLQETLTNPLTNQKLNKTKIWDTECSRLWKSIVNQKKTVLP